MSIFTIRNPEAYKAKTEARKAREAARKADYQARRNDLYVKMGKAPEGYETQMTADRFGIEVSENLTGWTGRLGTIRSGPHVGYRVIVTDKETGIPQTVKMELSYESAHRYGRQYVQKLCDGTKKLKNR